MIAPTDEGPPGDGMRDGAVVPLDSIPRRGTSSMGEPSWRMGCGQYRFTTCAVSTYWSVGSGDGRQCPASRARGTVERLFDRHLATTREWFPHQHVPYGRGRDFDAAEAWCVDSADLGGATIDDAVRSVLIVNLLTEDNLPYYFRTIERELGADGVWGRGRSGGPPRRAVTRWRSTAI